MLLPGTALAQHPATPDVPPAAGVRTVAISDAGFSPAALVVAPGSMIAVFFIPMPAVLFGVLYLAYTWYMDRQSRDNVNHSAHLWGAGFGLLFMALLEPRLVTRLLS